VDLDIARDGVPHPGRRDGAELGSAAFLHVLEAALPFAPLGLEPGHEVAVAVQVMRDEVEVERLPRYGYLTLSVPSPDFERIHWRV
jgi:hypothetical protein